MKQACPVNSLITELQHFITQRAKLLAGEGARDGVKQAWIHSPQYVHKESDGFISEVIWSQRTSDVVDSGRVISRRMKLKAAGAWLTMTAGSGQLCYGPHWHKTDGLILTPESRSSNEGVQTPKHLRQRAVTSNKTSPATMLTLYPHLPAGGTVNNSQYNKSS